MKKFSSFFLVVGCVLLLSLLVGVSCKAQSVKTEDVQKQLNKIFPNFKIAEVNPTPIKGIYEVVGAEGMGTILYYSPEDKGYLFFGEIWDTSGKSLTAERREEIQQKRIAQMLKDLPLDIAVKVGSGPKTVIEISDPTCPFCRKAYEELEKHKDVTKYVFFLPIHGEHSIKQISEILCSKDMAKALDDAYTGKLDTKSIKVTQECKSKVDKILQKSSELARNLGVRGTPFFIIEGKVIPGADIPRIQEALSQLQSKESK